MLPQDYFIKFGYVMDVYLPRDKVNRSEHRGFGFVTFETEAAVQRIHSHGQHQIKWEPQPVKHASVSHSVCMPLHRLKISVGSGSVLLVIDACMCYFF